MDESLKETIGRWISKALYKVGLLDATLSYTLECCECCRAFPENLKYIPCDEALHADPLIDYWDGPYCPVCGPKKEARILRLEEAHKLKRTSLKKDLTPTYRFPPDGEITVGFPGPEEGESGRARIDYEEER